MAKLLIALAALALAAALVSGNKNPCHNLKNVGKDVSCKVVRLPPAMCSACSLDLNNAPANKEGNFNSCKSIYNLRSSSCRAKMMAYRDANSCDPVREQQIADFDKYVSRGDTSSSHFKNTEEQLDYFMYSVCEQCCDCVPIGTPKGGSTDITLQRGNCPAHAVYDICRVLPEVGVFIEVGGAVPKKVKPICGALRNWLGSSKSKNWPTKEKVKINKKIKKFLQSHMDAAQCASRPVWEPCWELEHRQRRI